MFPSFLNVDNPPSSFCPSPLPFSLYSFSFIIIYVLITPKSLSPGQICGAQMIITAYYCPGHNYLKSACPTLNCGSLLPSSLISVSFPMFLFWVTQDQILEVIIDESNDSQPGVSFTPAQHVAMSEGIFGSHSLGEGQPRVTGVMWAEVRDVVKHLTRHRMPPHKEQPSQ